MLQQDSRIICLAAQRSESTCSYHAAYFKNKCHKISIKKSKRVNSVRSTTGRAWKGPYKGAVMSIMAVPSKSRSYTAYIIAINPWCLCFDVCQGPCCLEAKTSPEMAGLNLTHESSPTCGKLEERTPASSSYTKNRKCCLILLRFWFHIGQI